MRDLIRSLLRFFWAGPVFGAQQLSDALSPEGARRFDRLTKTAAAELNGPARTIYETGVRLQSDFFGGTDSGNTDANEGPLPPPRPASTGRLDMSSMVVLGEGLAAGMTNFSLSEPSQVSSFPAVLARQAGVSLAQPLFQPPGVGGAIGFEPWSVVVPSALQSTVFTQIPPPPAANLSVPGFTLADALRLRPRAPLVDAHDGKQTVANLILAVREIAYGAQPPLATQLECALNRNPTFAIVSLGFSEALQAAADGDPGQLPSASEWRSDFSSLVGRLRGAGCEVLVTTVPDPLDTAYFSDLAGACRVAKIDMDLLTDLWPIPADSYITLPGVNEMAFQILAGRFEPLPDNAVLPRSVGAEISSRVCVWNRIVRETAQHEGALVYDLHGFYAGLRRSGVAAGTRVLTADYLGGFYSLNGYYPGATGNALIAGEIMELIEREYDASFPAPDLAAIMAADPVAGYKPAPGPNWTRNQPPPQRGPAPPAPFRAASGAVSAKPAPTLPLTLPPGLEQVLPLNPSLSYFGDGLMALNENTPPTIQWGSGGNLLFGGLAMVDSHLSGSIRIRFSPPVNGQTNFELSFDSGLTGEDAVLMAPQFFRMPFQENRVDDIPGFVSAGVLDLNTGQVNPTPGANIFAQYSSSALTALRSVNPAFPAPPTKPLSFPGPYGSADIQFEQRPDGLLDFTFYGSTFVPLGPGIVWPLNFAGPGKQFATVPAAGTTIHPHLALSTRACAVEEHTGEPPEIRFNTIEEQILLTPVSSFGDIFTLHAAQLGGPATGRSHLMGRLQIQFGPRCGNSVPIAVSSTLAGGVLSPLDPTPIAQLFPGNLTPGPEGFDAILRFPLRSYSLNDLSVIDDPFDISVGAVDLRTGRLIHPLLHRGFINQDLIFALLRVEPRTPTNSFYFRGAGKLEQARHRAQVFHYFGNVHIPYPEGFLFPDPNLATGFPVGAASSLDPYLWFRAMSPARSPGSTKHASGHRILSNRGELFSYRFTIPADLASGQAEFEYENHSQAGRFRMHNLAWVASANSLTGSSEPDTFTFSCFGVWSKDGVEQVVQAAVQMYESREVQWIGIQVAQAEISNADSPLPASFYPVPTS